MTAWFSSYLSGGIQTVALNSCQSRVIIVTSVVPQNSHPDRLLFILYVNNLPECIQHSCVLMFADGVNLSLPFDSIHVTVLISKKCRKIFFDLKLKFDSHTEVSVKKAISLLWFIERWFK